MFKANAEKLGTAPGNFLQLTRVAVSGVAGGPQFFDMVSLIGKDEVCSRLVNFIKDRN